MVVYVAVDNNNGMMFNNRRQSQDKLLRADILNDCQNITLWMNQYSESQFFSDMTPNIVVDEDFLDKAGVEDACFVEESYIQDYEDKITKLVIYRWNRDYPADFYLDVDLKKWKKISSTDFIGNSHNKISKEEWIRQ